MTSLSDHERSNAILSAEVGWAPSTATESNPDLPNASVVGAAVAAAICLVIAAIGWQIAPEGWVAGIAGLPATTFLAWRMGPRIVAADRSGAVVQAFGLSFGTILITEVLVIVVLAGAAALDAIGSSSVPSLAEVPTAIASVVIWGLIVFLWGALMVGIPVAIVVVPAALVWAALVRRLVRRPA